MRCWTLGASAYGCFEPDHTQLDRPSSPLVSAALDEEGTWLISSLAEEAMPMLAATVFRVEVRHSKGRALTKFEGARPLHTVHGGENINVARSLLRNGADLNMPDDGGDTETKQRKHKNRIMIDAAKWRK